MSNLQLKLSPAKVCHCPNFFSRRLIRRSSKPQVMAVTKPLAPIHPIDGLSSLLHHSGAANKFQWLLLAAGVDAS